MAGNEEVIETLSLKIDVKYSGQKKLKEFGETVKELTPNVERLAQSLKPLVDALKMAGKSASGLKKATAISKIQDKNYEATKVTSSKKWGDLATSIRKVGYVAKASGKVVSNLSKGMVKGIGGIVGKVPSLVDKASSKVKPFLASIGRIAMYRAIRSAIKTITEAFSEGTSNAYQWSKGLGGSFAKAMDSIATSATYLKNSIGASLIPIFESLAPIIEKITDKIVDLINGINKFLSAAAGKSTWTKAIKKQVEYQKATEKTKKSLLGFDEINQLNGDDSALDDMSESFDFIEQKLNSNDISVKLGNIVAKFREKVKEFSAGWDEIKEKIKDSEIYNNLKQAFEDFAEWVGRFKDQLEDPDGRINKFVTNLLAIAQAIGEVLTAALTCEGPLGKFIESTKNGFGLTFGYIIDQFNNMCDMVYAIATGDWSGALEAMRQIFWRWVEFIVQKVLLVGKAIGSVLDIVGLDKLGWKDIDVHMWDITDPTTGKVPPKDSIGDTGTEFMETLKTNYPTANGTQTSTPTLTGNVFLDGKELYNSYVKYDKTAKKAHGGTGGGF